MGYEDALRSLMEDPAFVGLMRDSYIEEPATAAAHRFAESAEWAAVTRLIGPTIVGAHVLDLGAGNGIAAFAFVRAGARRVIALEPNPGPLAGRAAIESLGEPRITVLDGTGEAIPLADASVDVVYGRQVLHHAQDLGKMLGECARVMRSGGMAFFCREHVVDDSEQLAQFLAAHPVHRLVGGENAFSLASYLGAIRNAGLRLTKVLGPWDSIINAFPTVTTDEELWRALGAPYVRWFGPLGDVVSHIRLAMALVRRRWHARDREPGRLFSFLATKVRQV